MNLRDEKYASFGLVRDMLSTPDIIRNFAVEGVQEFLRMIQNRTIRNPSPHTGDRRNGLEIDSARASKLSLLFVGEGSSRFFPTNHAICRAAVQGSPHRIVSEGGLAAISRDLSDWMVIAVSNSGRSYELVELFRHMSNLGRNDRYLSVVEAQSPLHQMADGHLQLRCGSESAVAASKSVVEQALVCQSIVDLLSFPDRSLEVNYQLSGLSSAFQRTLAQNIDPAIVQKIASASVVYFVGKNDGVGEELALKTNEIIRKRGFYLQGTNALHGVEEVVEANDVIIWIDPVESLEARFQELFVDRIGASIIAIADQTSYFPTIQVPVHNLSAYLRLAGGWNLLVEVGLLSGLDIDRPLRARKIGNEDFDSIS